MKDVVQKMQKEIAKSQLRVKDLETKLAELPAEFGPETAALFKQQLASEKKYLEKMLLALAPPTSKKVPKFRIAIAALLLVYFFYRMVFKQA